MAAFDELFVRATPFGVLAGVALPEGFEPVPPAVLSRLSDADARSITAERGRKQIELTGGRLAFARALSVAGGSPTSLAVGPRGEPVCAGGWSVSISHKHDLALALVAPVERGTIGIDLEGGGRQPLTIASRVLRPEELEWFEALPVAEQWPALLVRFALKEATYKAIHPHLNRFVSFHEARVTRDALSVELLLKEGPALELEVQTERLGERVLAFARARRP